MCVPGTLSYGPHAGTHLRLEEALEESGYAHVKGPQIILGVGLDARPITLHRTLGARRQSAYTVAAELHQDTSRRHRLYWRPRRRRRRPTRPFLRPLWRALRIGSRSQPSPSSPRSHSARARFRLRSTPRRSSTNRLLRLTGFGSLSQTTYARLSPTAGLSSFRPLRFCGSRLEKPPTSGPMRSSLSTCRCPSS